MERHHPGHVTLRIKARRAVWNVTCALLFRPFGTLLFRRWRNLLLRLFGAHIHPTANVYASVRIWAPWQLRMESGFRDGKAGFVWHVLQGFWYRMLVDAKIYELLRSMDFDKARVRAYLEERR